MKQTSASLIKKLFFSGPVWLLSFVILVFSSPFTFIWRKLNQTPARDTSWEFGRDLIFAQGIPYWCNLLTRFQLQIKESEVLEVGSGNGQWLMAAEKLGAAKVVGLEPHDEVRNYSIEMIEKEGDFRKISVLKAGAESIPMRDASFDCLLCLGVFMFTQQNVALKEFERVLRPNGQLILTVNGLGYFIMKMKNGILYHQFDELRYGLAGIISSILKWAFGLQISVCAVNVKEMESKLSDLGFELERVWYHSDIDLYPHEHLGFPTNYAFLAHKKFS